MLLLPYHVYDVVIHPNALVWEPVVQLNEVGQVVRLQPLVDGLNDVCVVVVTGRAFEEQHEVSEVPEVKLRVLFDDLAQDSADALDDLWVLAVVVQFNC